MFAKLSFSVLAVISASILVGSSGQADCVRNISAYSRLNNFSEAVNLANAWDSRNTSRDQKISAFGAVAGAISEAIQTRELNLIFDAHDGNNSKLMMEFSQDVTKKLAKKYPNKSFSLQELFQAINLANAQSKICGGQFTGAYTFTGAAAVISDSIGLSR